MGQLLFYIIISTFPIVTADKSDSSTCYLRLKFNKSLSDSSSYLWEQQFPKNSPWAEQSFDSIRWQAIPGWQRNVKIGLALGGGMVRGIAHIGVLRAFEENNIPIAGIAGTSIGAIIGGLYACGYSPDELEKITTEEINWETLFSDELPRQSYPIWERLREEAKEPKVNLDIRWNRPDRWFNLTTGLRVAQKLTDEFEKLSLNADYRAGFDFNNLYLPFGALLTDIRAEKVELMRKGTIATAARASGSFPVVFEPVRIGQSLYIDGGVLDDLPVDAFTPFDSTRAPKNTMKINDREFNYIIAVYPSSVLKETSGKSSISVIDIALRTASIARDYYVKNNWNNADFRISMDVKGSFDFSPAKVRKMIDVGYTTTMEHIKQIKKEIAEKEHGSSISHIFCLSSIEVNGGNSQKKKILKAVKLKKGSYVEKIDICDALKRIYNIGNFSEVSAKIEKEDSINYKLIFSVKENPDYIKSDSLSVKIIPELSCNPEVAKAIQDTIQNRKKIIALYELKEIVEKNFVEEGVISLRVDSVNFYAYPGNDTLVIYVRNGKIIKGVSVYCAEEMLRNAIKTEFDSLSTFSPDKVFDMSNSVYKRFALKTIAITGVKEDSLLITADRKSTSTLQIPVITLWDNEGGTLFAELTTKRIKILGIGDWSPYVNWTSNYPLRNNKELITGRQVGIGIQSCLPLLPQANLQWSELQDSSYEFKEICFRTGIPCFYKHTSPFIITPGLEELVRFDTTPFDYKTNGILDIQWDNLDRVIFPESGCKGDIHLKFHNKIVQKNPLKFDNTSFFRAKIRTFGVFPWRPANRATFSGQVIGTWYSQNTPYYERYSFGGFNPYGIHQLKIIDYDYFPGHPRNGIMEQLMFMTAGTGRGTLIETSLLGVKAAIYLEASHYIVQPWEGLLKSKGQLEQSSVIGLHLDINYFNAGGGFITKNFSKFSGTFAYVTFYGF